MRIEAIDPRNEAAGILIAQADEYMVALYPSISNHLASVEELTRSNVLFVGAYSGSELVACGAVRTSDDDGVYGEIKRIFVMEQHRGKGISRVIMAYLENHLLTCGVKTARLETGIKQPAALGLYRKIGYVERGPFSNYIQDPLSVFMEKSIGA